MFRRLFLKVTPVLLFSRPPHSASHFHLHDPRLPALVTNRCSVIGQDSEAESRVEVSVKIRDVSMKLIELRT